MNNSTRLAIWAILSLFSSATYATTVSIAGVTTSGGARTGGYQVVLTVDQGGAGILGQTTSVSWGVYNLSVAGVQDDVSGLWLSCHPDSCNARPIPITLGSKNQGVRQGIARDLEVLDSISSSATISFDEAVEQMAALKETQNLWIRSGIFSTEKAGQREAEFLKHLTPKITTELPRDNGEIQDLLQNHANRAIRQEFRLESSGPSLSQDQEIEINGLSFGDPRMQDYQSIHQVTPEAIRELMNDPEKREKFSDHLEQQISAEEHRFRLYIKPNSRIETRDNNFTSGQSIIFDVKEGLKISPSARIKDKNLEKWLIENPIARDYYYLFSKQEDPHATDLQRFDAAQQLQNFELLGFN